MTTGSVPKKTCVRATLASTAGHAHRQNRTLHVFVRPAGRAGCVPRRETRARRPRARMMACALAAQGLTSAVPVSLDFLAGSARLILMNARPLRVFMALV